MKRILMTLTLAGVMCMGSMALAQDRPAAPGDNAGNNRGTRGQRMDPAQMRQMMLDRLKEQLKPTDEEWQVLAPQIEKVTNAQRATRDRGGWGGRGGPDRQAQPDANESEFQRASRELRTAVEDAGIGEASIIEKLAAYRAARDKAQADLDAARKELRELVTPRQEALLVTMSILE